jgi:hypothetical protein
VKLLARWWRENRLSAPTLFDDELAELIERLKLKPDLGLEYETVDGGIRSTNRVPDEARLLA